MSTRTLRLFSQIRDFQSWLKREEFGQKFLCFGLRLNKMVDCNKKNAYIFSKRNERYVLYSLFNKVYLFERPSNFEDNLKLNLQINKKFLQLNYKTTELMSPS